MKNVIFGMAVLFICRGLVFAQATATINGRVTDPGGAIIAGAQVTITNTSTGISRTAPTNDAGLFNVPGLIPGIYEAKVDSGGFASSTKQNVNLIASTTLTLDFTLSLATVSEKLEVTSAAPMIESTTSVVSSNLQSGELTTLPMINRNFLSALTVLPGVREMPSSSGLKGVQGGNISVGGGTGSNVLMLVDGVDNHDDNNAGTLMRYSIEGIQEFRLLTHNFSAEYGKSAGAVIVAATKSGTNQFHGSAFANGRSDALTKIDYFADPAHGGLGKPAYHREDFGGGFGGPIMKDRAFFAASFEQINQLFTVTVPANVTAQEQFLIPFGTIPASQIPQPLRTDLGTVKANFQLSKNNSAFARYSIEDDQLTNDGLGANHSLVLPYYDINHNRTWVLSAGITSVLNASTVNQFGFQYLHYLNEEFFPSCPNPQCLLTKLSFPSVGTGPLGNVNPWTNFIDKYQFKDDFSKQWGLHSVKFGVDFGIFPYWGAIFTVSTPGTITFFDDPSVIAGNTNNKYPQGFATPGIVKQISELIPFDPNIGTAPFTSKTNGAKDLGLYLQDDFKVTRRLTLNLGLRWDANINFLSRTSDLKNNRIYQTLKAIGSPYGVLPDYPMKDFAPRVGLAFDVSGNGRDVVRAGFGIFYDRALINSTYRQNLEQNTYFYASATQTDPAIGAGPLANFVFTGPNKTPVPALLPANLTNIPPGVGESGVWYAPNLPDGREQTASVGYSRQISNDTALSIDYTHTLGLHEWRNLDVNPLCTATFQGPCGIPGYALAAVGQRVLAPALQAVYGDPNRLGPVTILAPVNRSHYDELAVHFQRRASRQISFQANYTLAWAYGYGGVTNSDTVSGAPVPEIPSATGGCVLCPGEWGPAQADERHRLSLIGIIDLPFGIELSPSFTVASARPYQQYRAQNPDGDGLLRCYAGSCLVPSANGEVSVNAARGEALLILSARLSKSFSLGKKEGNKKIAAFVEMYNLTDRANFGPNYGPNGFSPATFNKPTTYLGGNGYNLTLPNSFQVQLGARFSF
jgi:hypothetical protein